MRLLIDTDILLWALSDDPRLNSKERSVLLEAQETIVSAATIWEISIRRALGKLKASRGSSGVCESRGLFTVIHNLGSC